MTFIIDFSRFATIEIYNWTVGQSHRILLNVDKDFLTWQLLHPASTFRTMNVLIQLIKTSTTTTATAMTNFSWLWKVYNSWILFTSYISLRHYHALTCNKITRLKNKSNKHCYGSFTLRQKRGVFALVLAIWSLKGYFYS